MSAYDCTVVITIVAHNYVEIEICNVQNVNFFLVLLVFLSKKLSIGKKPK